jgi:O-antigen ligase
VLLVPLIKPDFARTDFGQRLFSLHDPTQVGTFEWRQERWEHFLPIVLANPLFGVGDCEDRSLGADETARTPHNGYMARALVSGVPAMLILVFFGVQAVRHAVRSFRRATDASSRAMALATAAGLISLAVHNTVDSSIEFNPVMKLFWILVGLSISRA